MNPYDFCGPRPQTLFTLMSAVFNDVLERYTRKELPDELQAKCEEAVCSSMAEQLRNARLYGPEGDELRKRMDSMLTERVAAFLDTEEGQTMVAERAKNIVTQHASDRGYWGVPNGVHDAIIKALGERAGEALAAQPAGTLAEAVSTYIKEGAEKACVNYLKRVERKSAKRVEAAT